MNRFQRSDMAANIFAGCLVLVIAVVTVVAATGRPDAHPAAVPPSPSPSPSPREPALRTFAPEGLRVGSAVDVKVLHTHWAYRKVLAREFSAVTAESAMKWGQLEPRRGQYDWTSSDRLVEFAGANGQSVYGHTLVWHTDLPAWLPQDGSPEELRELLREHITTVVSRYRGKVWAWDVVNEVLADDGSMRDTVWLRELGPGYVADAFRWAHAADPQAVLFINDYGAEGRGAKADALYRLVGELRAAGVPVQGVGFQAHLRADTMPPGMEQNLGRFAKAGLRLAVTELDVRVRLPVTRKKLEQQAGVYRQVLKICLDQPACVSFTVWGFTDAFSWIPGYHRGYGVACLYDPDFVAKPAYTALRTLLTQRRVTASTSP